VAVSYKLAEPAHKAANRWLARASAAAIGTSIALSTVIGGQCQPKGAAAPLVRRRGALVRRCSHHPGHRGPFTLTPHQSWSPSCYGWWNCWAASDSPSRCSRSVGDGVLSLGGSSPGPSSRSSPSLTAIDKSRTVSPDILLAAAVGPCSGSASPEPGTQSPPRPIFSSRLPPQLLHCDP
jgi:hypothetical protein